jgi:hypothetical protein
VPLHTTADRLDDVEDANLRRRWRAVKVHSGKMRAQTDVDNHDERRAMPSLTPTVVPRERAKRASVGIYFAVPVTSRGE